MGYLKTRTSDFALDTIGHCFICLNEITPQLLQMKKEPDSSLQSSTYSLQYLSRYLKINMKKVFHDNENVSIPKHLVKTVEGSTLKVTLCEQCARWNAKLSKLYRQMEKIEVEAASYLELVRKQLLEADENGKSAVFRKLDNCDSSNGLRGKLKLEISEAIRTETMQKCFYKLNQIQPNIKIQRLKQHEIILRTKRFKMARLKSNDLNESHRETIRGPTSKLRDESFKSECQNENEASIDFENDCPEDFYQVEDEDDDSRQPDFPTSSLEKDGEHPSNTVRSSNYKQHVTKSDTGKFVCNLCSKEFAGDSGFIIHYKKAHLNIRFQCQICKKLFTEKTHLKTHQQSVHFKQRVECQFCPKSFTSTANRRHHIRLGKCSGNKSFEKT